MKVQWGRGVRGILLDKSNHTSHIQRGTAAAPGMTLVLLASLLSCFRYYLDPEFAQSWLGSVLLESGGTAHISKTTDLKLKNFTEVWKWPNPNFTSSIIQFSSFNCKKNFETRTHECSSPYMQFWLVQNLICSGLDLWEPNYGVCRGQSIAAMRY